MENKRDVGKSIVGNRCVSTWMNRFEICLIMSLSCRPTLSVSGWSISPIFDHGGPLRAPKQAEIHPKQQSIPLSTLYEGSMHPFHSKIAYRISLSCQSTLSVSGWSISPICDHGGPFQSPKTSRDTPKRTEFSFVHTLRG